MRMTDSSTNLRTAVTLHVHCARSMACASVAPCRNMPLELYTERSLAMAVPGDVVCLHLPPERRYLNYLQELGIGPRWDDLIICPDSFHLNQLPLSAKLALQSAAWNQLNDRLAGAEQVVVQPYITTRFEEALARRLTKELQRPVQLVGGSSCTIEHFDLKHHVRQLAQQLSIPVAPGEVVETVQAADWFELANAMRRQMQHTSAVIVRGAAGNGGSSVYVVRKPDEIAATICHLREHDQNTTFLVEALLEVVSSPNVGIYIDPHTREISCSTCTEQTMGSNLNHLGNQWPLANRLLPSMVAAAQRMASHLAESGVTGYLGFDFCQHTSPIGSERFILAELNPRLNGATYSHAMFDALQATQLRSDGPRLQCYATTFRPTRHTTYSQLERSISDLLFQPGHSAGVVPLFTGYLAQQKCGFMLVASESAALEELRDCLNVRTAAHTDRRRFAA